MSETLFSNDLLVRLVLALALIAAGFALYRLANRWVLYRAGHNKISECLKETGAVLPGAAAILYFTTPDCVPCRTIQRPALQRLQECLGDRLRVIEINAQEQPELASRWGVLSVPTTFIIDSRGQLRHVNHGATRAEKLLQQLEGI